MEQELISRLTAQLAEKLPSSSASHWIAPPNSLAPTAADVPPWILDPSVAHPLHAAYDARIAELQEIVRNLEGSTRDDSSAQYSQKQQHARALSSANSAAEAAQLESSSLREEVVQLRRICAELTQVVEERDVAAEAQLSQHRALTTSLQQVHSALKRLDAEKKSTDSVLLETQSSLTLLRTEHSETIKALREAAQEAESRELQLKSYRTAIEEVASRAGAEAEALALKAKTANEKKRELQEANESLAAELASVKAELESTRHELHSTRADAEHMLVSIQASESQLGAIESREAKARALELAAAEREAKAQRLVDIAVAGEEDAKRELARFLEKRRIELESQQAQEAEAVAAARSRLVEAASVREEEILRLRQDAASAQAAAERYQREASSAQSELSRAEALAASEQRRLSESIRLLSERVARAEEDKDAASHMAIQGEALAIERMRDAEAARAEAEQKALAAEAGIRRVSSALQNVESRNRQLSDKLLDVERALDAQRRESASFKMRAETAEADLVSEKGKSQRQSQFTSSHQSSETWAGSSSAHVDTGSSVGIAARQAQERAYVDEINRLRSKIREMSSLLIALQRDHAAAVNAANEAEESLVASRDACAQAEANASDLITQVSSAALREDSLLRSLADLRTQAELSKLKADRANARVESLSKKLEAAEAESVRLSLANPGGGRAFSTSYRQSLSTTALPTTRSSQIPPQPPKASKKIHSSSSTSRHSQSAVQASRAQNRTYSRSHRQTTLEDEELEEKLASLGIPPHVADLYEEHANDSAILSYVKTNSVRDPHPSVTSSLKTVPDIAQDSLQVTSTLNKEHNIAQKTIQDPAQPIKIARDSAEITSLGGAISEAPTSQIPIPDVKDIQAIEIQALTLPQSDPMPVTRDPPPAQTSTLLLPIIVPSSALLLSPRLPAAIHSNEENVDEVEEEFHAPTHDLDVSLADLEATVENLKQDNGDINAKKNVEIEERVDETLFKVATEDSVRPLPTFSENPSANKSIPLTPESCRQEVDKQNIGQQETGQQETGQQETGQQETGQEATDHEETVRQETGQTGREETGQEENQNNPAYTSPVSQEPKIVPQITFQTVHGSPSSPMFEIDEESSFGASPEPMANQRRDDVRIEQLPPPSNPVLSPSAALSSVSLSSPAFVINDEGEVDDYYGNEDDEDIEQSDSFDADEDDVEKRADTKMTKEEPTSSAFDMYDDENENEFGANQDLEEDDDDLDVDDAF
jgi:hypothetical protein